MSDKLLVIVGPTGSGKSDIALKVANKFNGEIICADSMTIYRYLDIGTAKPTRDDRLSVMHWGLDLIKPNEKYSAYQFKKFAEQAIKDIRKRGKLPIIVGGTGLYVDSIILDYSFSARNHDLRDKLQKMSTDQIKQYCIDNNIEAKITANQRHNVSAVLNALYSSGRRSAPDKDVLVVGITTNKEELKNRIRNRILNMIDRGVVYEATKVANIYGWSCYGLLGNIYPLVKKYVQGDIELSSLIDSAVKKDYQLAKRQLTWFKRHEFINWTDRDTAYKDICKIFYDYSL